MEQKRPLWQRILICAIGMFFYATGVALTKNCDLGISPIVSVAYALSLITGITLGWCTTLINLVLFALQRLLLSKQYPLRTMLAQFAMSVCFSLFIDGADWLWAFARPGVYPLRLALFVLGCAVLALGMCLVLQGEFVMLPAEGAVTALVQRLHSEFGTTKVCFDASMVVITAVLSLVFLKKLVGIREGTLIAVLLIGTFSKPIGVWLKRHLAPTAV